jgi:two-component system repressor protein LuxO
MQGTHHHILLAADTASQSALYKGYLKSQGVHARCVYTGRDILTTLDQDRYDLLFMDLNLPDGDAAWVLQNMNLSQFRGPILIAIPGNAPPHIADERITLVRRKAFTISAPLSMAQLHHSIVTLLDKIPNVTKGDAVRSDLSLPSSLAGMPLSDEEIFEILPPVSETRRAARADPTASDFGGFIGTSPTMLALYEQIQSAARSMAPVFITGESGTGKEVCAQAIHKHSPRAHKPFIPLNCAAIPRDLLESELFGHVRGAFTGAMFDRDGAATLADGGTLFLDEIGDMDPNMQTKLLRFLQDGTFQRVGGNTLETVKARIICATNRDPMADIRSGRLREDLFYRLHVLPVIMPPLRMRGEDVLDIAQTLLLRYAAEESKRFKGFAEDAETILRNYQWPGNIRQLQNIIRHAVVMHDGLVITARMLPIQMFHTKIPTPQQDSYVPQQSSQPAASLSLGHLDGSMPKAPSPRTRGGEGSGSIVPLHLLERQAIERAITACSGNIPRAAALLQVSPSTIYRKKAQWEDMDNAIHPPTNQQNTNDSDPDQPG